MIKKISELADFPLLTWRGRQFCCKTTRIGQAVPGLRGSEEDSVQSLCPQGSYVESLNLHLEDNMVLKGQRVDMTEKRDENSSSLEDIFI